MSPKGNAECGMCGFGAESALLEGFRAGGAGTSLVQREAGTAGDSPGATTLPLPLSQTKSWSFPDSVLM